MVKVMFLRGVRTRQPLLRGGDSGSPSVTDIFIAGNNAGGDGLSSSRVIVKQHWSD